MRWKEDFKKLVTNTNFLIGSWGHSSGNCSCWPQSLDYSHQGPGGSLCSFSIVCKLAEGTRMGLGTLAPNSPSYCHPIPYAFYQKSHLFISLQPCAQPPQSPCHSTHEGSRGTASLCFPLHHRMPCGPECQGTEIRGVLKTPRWLENENPANRAKSARQTRATVARAGSGALVVHRQQRN